MHNNQCHRVTAHLQLINIIIFLLNCLTLNKKVLLFFHTSHRIRMESLPSGLFRPSQTVSLYDWAPIYPETKKTHLTPFSCDFPLVCFAHLRESVCITGPRFTWRRKKNPSSSFLLWFSSGVCRHPGDLNKTEHDLHFLAVTEVSKQLESLLSSPKGVQSTWRVTLTSNPRHMSNGRSSPKTTYWLL